MTSKLPPSPGARSVALSWWPVALLLAAPLPAGAQAAPSRLVHQFLELRLSPDAAHVASVEGDAPAGGFYPDVRDLLIRSTNGLAEVRVTLPCGRVPQCWPGSVAWSPDGRVLSFTVRTP